MAKKLVVSRAELFQEVDARLTDIRQLFTKLAGDPAAAPSAQPESGLDRLQLARLLLWGRSLLEKEVAPDLFADPALNILLTLYVSEGDGADVSTTAVCMAAGVPTTTALRWINVLTRRSMVQKRSLPTDRRFTYLGLSDDTRSTLDRFFDLILARAAKP